MIYLIGSLKNPNVPLVAVDLRLEGFEVFDAWYSAGPDADDKWREHERIRGRTFLEALQGSHAQFVYRFDREHLERATTAVLLLPAGKSGHLELGWALGNGKHGYILMNSEPERFDVMYDFADRVFANQDDLVAELHTVEEAHVSSARRR